MSKKAENRIQKYRAQQQAEAKFSGEQSLWFTSGPRVRVIVEKTTKKGGRKK